MPALAGIICPKVDEGVNDDGYRASFGLALDCAGALGSPGPRFEKARRGMKMKTFVLGRVGVLVAMLASSQSVFGQEIMNWDCRIEHSNDGCKKTIKAPSGKKIVSVTAACNLENGAVSDRQLESVPTNTIRVVQKSDWRFWESFLSQRGYCYVGGTKIESGEKTIANVNGVNQIVGGCYEHDKNGGDCHIRGTLTLEDGSGTTPERIISVSKEGAGTSAVFIVNGRGFTPNKLVVNRATAAVFQQIQFGETARADGTYEARRSIACQSGLQITFTAFEDAAPQLTRANVVVTSCP